jgi:hypothetical protein
MQASIGLDEQMGKRQLETWLGRQEGAHQSREFVLAVLRDIFLNDRDISVWLAARRPELGGASAEDLLATSRAVEVERLAIKAWNHR